MSRNDPPALTCGFPGCWKPTRERKAFCTEHVSEHPYVRTLVDRLQAVEKELDRVRRRGVRAAKVDSIPAQEILRELRSFGHRTVERLARDLRIDPLIIERYGKALARAGKIEIGETKRGLLLLSIPEAGEAGAA